MWRTLRNNRTLHLLSIALFVLSAMVAVLYAASYIVENDQAQTLVQNFGYAGVVLVSFIAGLNLIVPIPAGAFVPIFVAGGIALPLVIMLLVCGTMLANIVAYGFGRLGRTYTSTHYPKLQAKITQLYTERRHLLPYFVFGFSALIPLPNEVYLLPLGIIGVPLRVFILPLLAGTIIYQSLFALGAYNVFLAFLQLS